MITVGTLLKRCFGFVRARPRLIGRWALFLFAVSMALQTLRPILLPSPASLADPTTLRLSSLPFELAGWLEFLVLFNAVTRAILQPERSRFAYLRLGPDELRTVGLAILFLLAIVVLALVGGLFSGLVATAVWAMGLASLPAAVFLLFVASWFGGTIFIAVRLLPAFPLTMARRKLVIGPAWRLTRGHFWRLFGTALTIWLIVILVVTILSIPFVQPIFGDLLRPDDPAARARIASFLIAQSQMSWLYRLSLAIAGSLAMAPLLALHFSLNAIATQALTAGGEPRARTGPWADPD